MKVICELYLILEASNKSVKVFTQDITEEVSKGMSFDRHAYSVIDFDRLCNKIAEDFRTHWENTNYLGGRTFARTRIRMED